MLLSAFLSIVLLVREAISGAERTTPAGRFARNAQATTPIKFCPKPKAVQGGVNIAHMCINLQAPLCAPYHTMTAFPSGTILRFSCSKGFQLVGKATTTTCTTRGQWSPYTFPRCTRVNVTNHCPDPGAPAGGVSNNTQKLNMLPIGSVLSFKCSVGLRLFGQSTIKCLANGTWNSSRPSCPACTTPTTTHLLFGSIVGLQSNTRSNYSYLSTVKYTCPHTGSKISNESNGIKSKTIRCEATGTWNDTTKIVCSPVECPPPAKRSLPRVNGNITGTDYTYLSVVTYHCYRRGWKIANESNGVKVKSIKCGSSGKWNDTFIGCGPVVCTWPGRPNTRANVSSSTFGGKATFSCFGKGWKFLGHPYVVREIFSWCDENGVWNVSTPTCERVTCPSLPSTIPNGIISASSNTSGSMAIIQCRNGFFFSSVQTVILNRLTIWCRIPGTWSIQKPYKCEAVVCGSLGSFNNGKITTSGNRLGGKATFRCDSGWKFVGKPKSVQEISSWCNEKGMWNVSTPACQRVSCPALPSTFEKGTITASSYMYGATAVVQCNIGFAITGMSTSSPDRLTLHCKSDGTWSNSTQFKCEGVSCPALPSTFEKGTITASSYMYGATAVVQCNIGFAITGMSTSSPDRLTLHCKSDGTWSNSTQFKCEEIPQLISPHGTTYIIEKGNSVTLQVIAIFPPSVKSSQTWFTPSGSIVVQHQQSSQTYELQLHDVRHEFTGNYTLTVALATGTKNSITLQLIVVVPPTLVIHGLADRDMLVGSNVSMVVGFLTDPYPAVTPIWYTAHSEAIHSAGRFSVAKSGHQWTLSITNIQKMDAGEYFCNATNFFSTSAVRFSLTVTEDKGTASPSKEGGSDSQQYIAIVLGIGGALLVLIGAAIAVLHFRRNHRVNEQNIIPHQQTHPKRPAMKDNAAYEGHSKISPTQRKRRQPLRQFFATKPSQQLAFSNKVFSELVYDELGRTEEESMKMESLGQMSERPEYASLDWETEVTRGKQGVRNPLFMSDGEYSTLQREKVRSGNAQLQNSQQTLRSSSPSAFQPPTSTANYGNKDDAVYSRLDTLSRKGPAATVMADNNDDDEQYSRLGSISCSSGDSDAQNKQLGSFRQSIAPSSYEIVDELDGDEQGETSNRGSAKKQSFYAAVDIAVSTALKADTDFHTKTVPSSTSEEDIIGCDNLSQAPNEEREGYQEDPGYANIPIELAVKETRPLPQGTEEAGDIQPLKNPLHVPKRSVKRTESAPVATDTKLETFSNPSNGIVRQRANNSDILYAIPQRKVGSLKQRTPRNQPHVDSLQAVAEQTVDIDVKVTSQQSIGNLQKESSEQSLGDTIACPLMSNLPDTAPDRQPVASVKPEEARSGNAKDLYAVPRRKVRSQRQATSTNQPTITVGPVQESSGTCKSSIE